VRRSGIEAYQWIHPVVAVFTLGFLGTTAWSKMRPKKYGRLHYTLGLSTLAGILGSVGLGVYTFLRVEDECACTDAFPLILFVHAPLAFLLLLFVLAQATMGVTMLIKGRGDRLFRTHRFNARILLGLGTSVLIAGVGTVVFLLV